ncbi:MAG: hypothetical protein P1T08_09350 [Acidimicrobiia bacterium]|nr:hypothetical protein [Acidimicrobiia bacterium]
MEEAAVLLRIGRTKAYAMAREWRETDGRSGLPVVDLGHVLRVPRRALEELIGAELTDVERPTRAEETKDAALPAEPLKPPATKPAEATPRNSRRQNRTASQLDFFDSQPRST